MQKLSDQEDSTIFKQICNENSVVPISNLLIQLGLNNYESKIYVALVREGISTAKNISEITKIPYGKVYEIINSLSKKGFITIFPTKPIKCQAVPPREVIANIRKTTYEKLESIEKTMINVLEPLFLTNKKTSTDPKNVFWVVHGRANINKKIEEIILNSKKNVNIITTENGIKRLVFYKDLLKKAKEKGASINLLCRTTKDNMDDINSLKEICNIKYSDKNMNCYFSNGESSIIIEPLPDDENFRQGSDFGIWLSSNSFTRFFDELFNSHFKNSTDREKKIKSILK